MAPLGPGCTGSSSLPPRTRLSWRTSPARPRTTQRPLGAGLIRGGREDRGKPHAGRSRHTLAGTTVVDYRASRDGRGAPRALPRHPGRREPPPTTGPTAAPRATSAADASRTRPCPPRPSGNPRDRHDGRPRARSPTGPSPTIKPPRIRVITRRRSSVEACGGTAHRAVGSAHGIPRGHRGPRRRPYRGRVVIMTGPYFRTAPWCRAVHAWPRTGGRRRSGRTPRRPAPTQGHRSRTSSGRPPGRSR